VYAPGVRAHVFLSVRRVARLLFLIKPPPTRAGDGATFDKIYGRRRKNNTVDEMLREPKDELPQ